MTPEQQRITDAFFLGLVCWREARGEPDEAINEVAHSLLNRVRNPKWWGADISGVATRKWQYSSMTDPKDPQLVKWPTQSDPSWEKCLSIGMDALDGKTAPKFQGADSYYDTLIQAPVWAKPEMCLGRSGGLIFFNTDGTNPKNAGVT